MAKVLGWVILLVGALIGLYPALGMSISFMDNIVVPIVGFVLVIIGGWLIGRRPRVMMPINVPA